MDSNFVGLIKILVIGTCLNFFLFLGGEKIALRSINYRLGVLWSNSRNLNLAIV